MSTTTSPNLAAAAPSTWTPDRSAGARHWRLYCAFNLIDPAAWELERQARPARAEDLAANGPQEPAEPAP